LYFHPYIHFSAFLKLFCITWYHFILLFLGIPKKDIKNTVYNITKNNNGFEEKTKKEITHILEIVLEQNYFQFDREYYKQTDGLAMGVPTSTILAEMYRVIPCEVIQIGRLTIFLKKYILYTYFYRFLNFKNIFWKIQIRSVHPAQPFV
jgi:hypothetical protein